MPGSGPGRLGSGLRIFFLFLKIDFRCQSATTDTKKRPFFVSKKWYRLAQPIPITSYQSIRKTVFVVVSPNMGEPTLKTFIQMFVSYNTVERVVLSSQRYHDLAGWFNITVEHNAYHE
jgi:hypothetical protein